MFATATKWQRIVSITSQQMRTKTTKSFLLNKKFEGFPTEANFKLVKEELPPLKDGQFLAQAEFVSVDPYMRTFSTAEHVGKPVMGEQVAKIIESKNPNYPVGEHVLGEFGWRSYTISNGNPGNFFQLAPRILKDFNELSRSLALGVLGMPGNTAYFGFVKLCQPVEGNTVVISGASGAVGMHVGQIAKIKGCHVVGIAGSDEKGERLIKKLNFDAFVNYKSPNFEQQLAEATPNRVDCYFDNVGGEVSSAVINRMNQFGRVAVCGTISTYNEQDRAKVWDVITPIKLNQVRVEGFRVLRWREQWDEGIQQNLQWVREGKLKYFETITEGFENTSKAFIGMLKGENFGKAIVKI